MQTQLQTEPMGKPLHGAVMEPTTWRYVTPRELKKEAVATCTVTGMTPAQLFHTIVELERQIHRASVESIRREHQLQLQIAELKVEYHSKLTAIESRLREAAEARDRERSETFSDLLPTPKVSDNPCST